MKTNNILVAENPVQWKTMIRASGNEPPALGEEIDDNDIAPYYTRGDRNQFLGKDILLAIRKCEPSVRQLLTKTIGPDGRIVYIGVDDNFVDSVWDNQTAAEMRVIVDFLTLLGGTGSVRRIQKIKQSEDAEKKKQLKANGGAAVVKGEMSAESNDAHSSMYESTSENTATFSAKSPDFDAAEKMLKSNPKLQSEFAVLLDVAKRGGDLSQDRDYKFEVAKTLTKSCEDAIAVGAKYKVIDAAMEMSLKEKLKIASSRVDILHWDIKISR